ncbi:MAG: hypothetical protein AB1631_22055 [Acidobacteriota bacterium]
MDQQSASEKKWTLTREAFDLLLAEFDRDRERAGAKYEEIRRKLIKFFTWRGCSSPVDCADDTIDRVAKKLLQGAQLLVKDPYLYFHGVALNVLREYWKDRERSVSSIEEMTPSKELAENPFHLKQRDEERLEMEQRLECMKECIRKLSPENLSLINEYHQGEKREKIERRRRLAERLNIPISVLRIRAFRIRAGLENCIEGCMKRKIRK